MVDSMARHSPRDFLLRAESLVSSGSAEKAQQPLYINIVSVTAAWNPHSNRNRTYHLRRAYEGYHRGLSAPQVQSFKEEAAKRRVLSESPKPPTRLTKAVQHVL